MDLREHQDLVYSLCFRVLRHRQDAEDATQEALLKISAQADPAKGRGWIYRVALNTAADVARRRRTRSGYESRALPPAHEDPAAVHQAVAELPDAERNAVVEHYFHRRTLREIARDEGVTEQAVWKRVEKAKERLRGALALGVAATIPFLESTARAAVRRLALVGAPLALLATLGTVAVTRAGAEPPPAALEVSRRSPIVGTQEVEPPPPAPVAAPPPRRETAARKPYPLALPPASWTDARKQLWRRLRETRVTVDQHNVPMRTLLDDLQLLSRETFRMDADFRGETVSFKVADIVLDGALRLVLQPRGFGFETQDDGQVRIAREDQLATPRDGDATRILSILHRLDQARRRLAEGWDGVDPLLDVERRVHADRARLLPAQQPPMERFELLKSVLGTDIIVDSAVGEAGMAYLQEPRGFDAVEGQLAEHLDRLCGDGGLGWCVPHGTLVLVTSAAAARRQKEVRAEQIALGRTLATRLSQPLPDPPPATLPELADRAAVLLGAPVHLSEAAWAADLRPSTGTLREALDRCGFRWGLLDGELFIVDPR